MTQEQLSEFMKEKFASIVELLNGDSCGIPTITTEPIEDTIRDIVAYYMILWAYIQEKG